MNELFHAYVIGGPRQQAKLYIDTLLDSFEKEFEKNSSEQVTFSIEDARALHAWQKLSSGAQLPKVHISYADFITLEAQQALLKTFEEPTPYTHLFLCLPNPEVLLETLRSRVRIVVPEAIKKNSEQAVHFLRASCAKRLAFVSTLLEKSEDEEASAMVREKALSFVNELEQELSKDVTKNREQLTLILELKSYLYLSGVSVRMIMEALALQV